MRAVVATGESGNEAIAVRDVPRPEPGGAEIRVRVRAAGLNRADLLQSLGRYPAPPGSPPDLLGLEFAGEVEALGPKCLGRQKVGDRVFGVVGGGGLAEFVLTHERLAVPIPANLDFEHAAAVPEAFLTAHDALAAQGRLQAGERVLIHAVGGGVGSAAAMVAHAMGCTVFGTSRTPEKLRLAAEVGLDHGVLTSESDWPEEVRRLAGGEGVNVVLDLLGGEFWKGNVEVLDRLGSLVVVGLLTGSTAQVDLRAVMNKRLTVVGTTLRARPLEEKIAATRRFAATVVPWLERGLVRPNVDRVFPLDQIHAARDRMTSNAGFGKIVLIP